MLYNMLFIWVEGSDDERFFNLISEELLANKYDAIQIRKYAHEKEEKIDKFLKSIMSMGADYVFVCDIDSHVCVTSKKQDIQKRYKNIDPAKIMVVIKEIESWYVAGLDRSVCEELKMKYIYYTNEVTKESFNNMLPKNMQSRLGFVLELLNHFSTEAIKDRNDSLCYFIAKYCG